MKIQDKDLVLGIAHDITDRKHMEEAVKESEEKFRLLAENSPDLIYQLDVDGKVIYCSPAVEKVLGLKVDEIIGATFKNFISEENMARGFELMENLIEGRSVEPLELKMTTKNGSAIQFTVL